MALYCRNFDWARNYFAANLTQAREMSDRFREAQARNNLGTVAYEQDLEAALARRAELDLDQVVEQILAEG